MKDIDEIMKNPAFRAITPEQANALKGLVTKLQDKSVTEAMPIMLQFMATAPKGRELTSEEQSAMTEAVISSLSETEQDKFRSMMKMADMMKKH